MLRLIVMLVVLGVPTLATAQQIDNAGKGLAYALDPCADCHAVVCCKRLSPVPLDRWGSHAGKSSYSGLGNWVSKKLVGIEVCNAGRLIKTADGYEPWWNKNYNPGDPRKTLFPEDEVQPCGVR